MSASSSSLNTSDSISFLLNSPTAEEDAVYYQQLCEELGGKVVVHPHTNPEKGRGLFAQSGISEGEDGGIGLFTLHAACRWSTKPFTNHILECYWSGTLEDQLHWYLLNKEDISEAEAALMELLDDKEIKLPRFDDHHRSDVVYCKCGAVYCSEECKIEALASYHAFLCPEVQRTSRKGNERVAEQLEQFCSFCEETNPSLYLAAKGLSQCMRPFSVSDELVDDSSFQSSLKSAWRPFWHAWRPLWWDCVPAPSDLQDGIAFKAELRDLVTRATATMKDVLNLPAANVFFDPEVFGSVMGMIEQNNITISTPSPLEHYIDQLNEADDLLVQSLWERYPILKDILIHAAQHSAEGSGYYRVACCANHSCLPNAQGIKRNTPDNNHRLILIARQDIHPGDEITISYIDEKATCEERKDALRDYGFLCSCPKCKPHP